jgi:hypothetical protein
MITGCNVSRANPNSWHKQVGPISRNPHLALQRLLGPSNLLVRKHGLRVDLSHGEGLPRSAVPATAELISRCLSLRSLPEMARSLYYVSRLVVFAGRGLRSRHALLLPSGDWTVSHFV